MKIIIVGGGKVGTYLTNLLLTAGHQVKLIEGNEKNFLRIAGDFPGGIVLHKNPTDPKDLEEIGLFDVDVLAAVTDEDEKNLVISTLAKMEFSVPKVIARVNNPRNAWLFNIGMGVDVGVNQADIISHLVLEEMNLENMLTLMKLNRGEYSIVQMNVKETSKSANKKVKDLEIPRNTVLISITRNNAVIIPKGDSEILAHDEILMLTDEPSRMALHDLFVL